MRTLRRPMRWKCALAGAITIVALAAISSPLLTAALSVAPTQPQPISAPTPPHPPTSASTSAVEAAAALPLIDPAIETPDYRRDEFGKRWADVDGNGCDQRQDVLTRDLTETTHDGCTVLTGTLEDPYTGTEVAFQHDRVAEPGNAGSQGVQIDHIISLSAAYQGGAWTWSPQQRETFANETTNLLAVDGKTNQAKSDRGPAEWMPPDPAHWCEYAEAYTRIATDWNLAIESADRDMLVATLTACAAP